jgi:REP element-mobilizing transposase RayT
MARVLAYHLILTAYGFWLPNDPRGSWSEFVRAWELYRFGGPATKTDEKRSLAKDRHDVRLRLGAKHFLKRPAVKFSGRQARAIAQGFSNYCSRSGCCIYALSVLPTHVHAVVERHNYPIEQVARLLKQSATRQFMEEKLHPFARDRYADRAHPSPWTRHSWSVFLESDADVQRAISYVEQNPIREGLPRQHWNLVTPFLPA